MFSVHAIQYLSHLFLSFVFLIPAQSKSMLMENEETRREEAPELLLSEQKISLESCTR